jgi:signal transduction histidine kinase
LKRTKKEFVASEKFDGVSKMTSYICHEIKSPLTSIKMNIDMLLRNNDFSELTCKSLSVIRCEIMRLHNLITNILEYSKKEKLCLSEISLYDLVNSIENIFAPQFDEKGINFINRAYNHIVLGDIQRLKSVFILLIENSISAVSENGLIEISSSANNGKCSIFIRDNGYGIKNKENIFDPFFTTKENGTGLGLAIAKSIIERHEGKIKLISSKPGETIFEIKIKTGNSS